MRATNRPSLLKPKHWPAWYALGLMWLLSHLGYRTQLWLGDKIGRLCYKLLKNRTDVTRANIRLCFPNLSQSQQESLVVQHFSSLAIGLFEVGMCWWWRAERLQKLSEIIGLNNLDEALAQEGSGAILLSGHFTTLEVSARLLTLQRDIDAMFRPHNNPVFAWAMQKYRGRHAGHAIARSDLRAILRSLKSNRVVWYAPDQSATSKGSVLAPFFGEPCNTNTATAKFCKMTKAKVVPFFGWRKPNGGYVLELLPAIENFPTGDDLADATRINQIIEQAVMRAPDQYLWTHKRFKNRGDNLPNAYSKAHSKP